MDVHESPEPGPRPEGDEITQTGAQAGKDAAEAAQARTLTPLFEDNGIKGAENMQPEPDSSPPLTRTEKIYKFIHRISAYSWHRKKELEEFTKNSLSEAADYLGGASYNPILFGAMKFMGLGKALAAAISGGVLTAWVVGHFTLIRAPRKIAGAFLTEPGRKPLRSQH